MARTPNYMDADTQDGACREAAEIIAIHDAIDALEDADMATDGDHYILEQMRTDLETHVVEMRQRYFDRYLCDPERFAQTKRARLNRAKRLMERTQ